MTASPFVTACPACGTRFRVNAAQRNAAGGQVRCGACLEVFVANDVQGGVDAQPDDHGENPRSTMLDASDHETRSAAAAAAATAVNAGESAVPANAMAPMPAPVAAASDIADVPDAQSLRQHRFMVLEPRNETTSAPADPTTRRRPVLEGELEPGLSSVQRAQFNYLANDSLEPQLAPQPSRWRWVGLVAAAALLLVAQLLYFQVDRWSSVAAVRPVYSGLCLVLGCSVPIYRDDKAMRSENVVVRPHPERSDVLLVDAQVINKAPYPQAFPQLQIDLLDRSGQIISSRVFAADDYRTGELATMPDVPPNRPLQISVEVYRPRENVSSYHFQLLPPRGRT